LLLKIRIFEHDGAATVERQLKIPLGGRDAVGVAEVEGQGCAAAGRDNAGAGIETELARPLVDPSSRYWYSPE
jgi:hypothetical protein